MERFVFHKNISYYGPKERVEAPKDLGDIKCLITEMSLSCQYQPLELSIQELHGKLHFPKP